MIERADSKRISVDLDHLDHDGRNLVKVKWRRDLPWGSAYCIPRGMLEQYSAEARSRLEALVNEAMRGNLRHSGGLLKELAQAGHRLYRALFHDPDGNGKATKIRERLKSLTGEHKISFSMGVPLHVPWGLVYDGDLNELSGDATDLEYSHYRDFWCIKYRVASVYYTVDPEGADQPLSSRSLRLHSVFNKDVLDRTGPHLTKCGAAFWNWIVNQFGPPIFSQKDWLLRWNAEYNTVGVLYFYGHADSGNIGLASNDIISANDLAQELTGRRGFTSPPCLVFLNGCSTAVGDPKGGFLLATAGSRFCGFIGAEASIPEVFALRFGSAFLYKFLTGEGTVLQIMEDLRQQHWPLSLLYNVYCVPDLKIMPDSTERSAIPGPNFCDFDLGAHGI